METKEILSIITFGALGMYLICSFANKTVDKKICSVFMVLAVVLMTVNQLMSEETKEEIEDDKLNIIQTWKTLTIPKKYQKFRDNLKKLNPNANYIFFTDNDIVKFINLNYPEYKDTFDNFTYTIQKIDFFRYLAIYHYGGVYLDLDIEIYKSLHTIDRTKAVFPIEFLKNDDLLLQNQGMDYLIGNYAFYAPKKHPFIKQIIDNINNERIKIKNSLDDKNKYVYYTTGPVMVSQSYLDYNSGKGHSNCKVILIKPESFEQSCFGDYGKHRNMGSWK